MKQINDVIAFGSWLIHTSFDVDEHRADKLTDLLSEWLKPEQFVLVWIAAFLDDKGLEYLLFDDALVLSSTTPFSDRYHVEISVALDLKALGTIGFWGEEQGRRYQRRSHDGAQCD